MHQLTHREHFVLHTISRLWVHKCIKSYNTQVGLDVWSHTSMTWHINFWHINFSSMSSQMYELIQNTGSAWCMKSYKYHMTHQFLIDELISDPYWTLPRVTGEDPPRDAQRRLLGAVPTCYCLPLPKRKKVYRPTNKAGKYAIRLSSIFFFSRERTIGYAIANLQGKRRPIFADLTKELVKKCFSNVLRQKRFNI